jgi:class 3 adenylate cyclase
MNERTGYAQIGEEQIAYRVTGDGDPPILYAPPLGHLEVALEEPTFAYFAGRLAAMGRLIRFDRRGSGTSDPLPAGTPATWETWTHDVVAVLDATDTAQAVIIGAHDAGPMAILFAATFPERALALVLANTTSRYLVSDDYPHGFAPEVAERVVGGVTENWGTESTTDVVIPSMADNPRFRAWYAKFQRAGATPHAAGRHFSELLHLDIRHALTSIRTPTLVLHRSDVAVIPIAHGRSIADHIVGARFVEIPGRDMTMYTEGTDLILDHVEKFLADVAVAGSARTVAERALATVLFTDIVSSTERAASAGDRRWRQLLDTYDDIAKRHVDRAQGRLVKRTGDGTLAVFDGPGRAISCAARISEAVRDVGLRVRAGIHCGEVELRGEDVGGIAVHIASRVAGQAGADEIVVSRTVKDLVAGSGFAFEDRGMHDLKGVPDPWQLFTVVEGAPAR